MRQTSSIAEQQKGRDRQHHRAEEEVPEEAVQRLISRVTLQ